LTFDDIGLIVSAPETGPLEDHLLDADGMAWEAMTAGLSRM